METEDAQKLAKLQQQVDDHLISCGGHYKRNDMAHEKLIAQMNSVSARLWALILMLFTLGVGALIRVLGVGA